MRFFVRFLEYSRQKYSEMGLYCKYIYCRLFPMIDKDDVKHIARLARLGLTDEETTRFSGQLSSVFEYMGILNEVSTEGVEPTSQVTGLKTVAQADEIEKKYDSDELLMCTEMPKERHQIRVKPVFE